MGSNPATPTVCELPEPGGHPLLSGPAGAPGAIMLAASADPRTLDRCSSASTTYSSRCPPGRSNARGFFVGVLGMTEVEKPLVLADRGGAWFRAGGLEVHLGVEADFRPARKAHPGIVVEDLDEVARRVATTGQDVRWERDFPGYRRFSAHDPFGNRLEFLQTL